MRKFFQNRRLPLLCVLLLFAFAALVCVLSSSGAVGSSNSGGAAFDAFTQELFCNELSENTLSLHYTLENPKAYGIDDYSISFGDISKEGRQDTMEETKNYLETLKRFSSKKLSARQKLLYDLLYRFFEEQISLFPYELYQEVLTPNNGIQAQLPILLAEYRLTDSQDIEEYLRLLSQTDTYFSQIMDFEDEKASAGLFMSDSLCVQVIESCENFLASGDENVLLSSFEARLENIPELSAEQKAAYIEENKTIFAGHVLPAYESMIHRMTALLGSGRNAWGLCNYDNGCDYYTLLVQSDTGCTLSVEELDEMITSERNRDLSTCSSLLSDNPSLIDKCETYDWNFKDETEMISVLQEKMQRDFPSPVDDTYTINYVCEALEDALAPAFYITAPLDNTSSNCIYINKAKDYSDINYFTTLSHEGYPGHLYQTTMSYSYGFEPVRSILDYPGYIEGWATYVELLSYHYAGLEEAVATLLECNQAVTLSLYATSDIGIHYYGWEEEELLDFWDDYGISDPDTIKKIAELIVADPGNYLKYYIGYLEFASLREEMEQLYPDSFRLKDFHEAVLRIGPAPFDILRTYLLDYYND